MYEQKRLVNIFKQFVEKAFMPAIKNNDSVIAEWQYFSSLISQQSIDYNKLQIYLEVLNTPKTFHTSYKDDTSNKKQQDKLKNNSGTHQKKKDQINQNPSTTTFNPSKTFGGQRSKFNMFPMKPQFDQAPSYQQQESHFYKKQEKVVKPTNPFSKILANMQVIHKTLLDNQNKLQKATNGNSAYYNKTQDKKYY